MKNVIKFVGQVKCASLTHAISYMPWKLTLKILGRLFLT